MQKRNYMLTAQSWLKQLPCAKGDEEIKEALTGKHKRALDLDEAIKKLQDKYTLTQIYKVYYQNF